MQQASGAASAASWALIDIIAIMGMDELSVSPASILPLRKKIRSL